MATTKHNNDIMPARRFKEKKFLKIGLEGKWLEKYGDVEVGKTFFIWGESGGGKSTEAIKLFDYLTQIHGKGLYIACEEGLGGILQDRIDEHISTANNNYCVCSQKTDYKGLIAIEQAKPLRSRFRVIVIDSYQLYCNMKYAQYKELREALPWATIIGINQMKPDGEPYGGNQIRHDADIKVQIVGGKAAITSRYLPQSHTVTLYKKRNNSPQTSLSF
jgi:hypothetical protein